jgi:hypothetical protein
MPVSSRNRRNSLKTKDGDTFCLNKQWFVAVKKPPSFVAGDEELFVGFAAG